jgi:hypothetical protein
MQDYKRKKLTSNLTNQILFGLSPISHFDEHLDTFLGADSRVLILSVSYKIRIIYEKKKEDHWSVELLAYRLEHKSSCGRIHA